MARTRTGRLTMEQIVVRGLNKTYGTPEGGRKDVLVNVNLTVERGEFVALLGPSGCGKTTLLHILAGLASADSGEVTIRASVSDRPVVSYMFQESRLLPWMTVEENLAFVLDSNERTKRQRTGDWLDRVGLKDVGRYYPKQLSVGMQQRVAVARALIVDPDVLFMDEPFSSLDELTAMTMRQELLELWGDLGCTVVLVTHNPLEAVLLADRVIVMTPSPGRITGTMELSTRLPRPRDADDDAIWRVSREAVSELRAGRKEAAPF